MNKRWYDEEKLNSAGNPKQRPKNVLLLMLKEQLNQIGSVLESEVIWETDLDEKS